ncbi:MAG: arylsulfatase [Verrucomicrobia bacterium]|nr:arylsulfatase [Verrucomicrobiota bacterium]
MLLAPQAAPAAVAPRPNIVFILADDLGNNDLSCQGATKLRTPNIDRIAKEGIRFTDAHTASGICCPSRYSTLTGRYPWRRKQTCWASPGAALLIEPGRMTIASLLKQAGYTTGGVGKWHLGLGTASQRVDWNGELKPGPLEVGFDYFFADVSNRWGAYAEDHRIVGVKPDDPIRFEGQKLVSGKSAFTMVNEENARVLHGKAVAFVERSKDKPFFLYYAPNNIHTPLTPNAKFKGTSQAGKYGDFVHELDWSVGELLATLDRLKLTDSTLVIFTSDNGGVYEKEGFNAGHRSCAPFNGQKGDVWEGGNRVPFLARWPGHITPGTTSAQLLCLTDMMATFAALTGQTLPPDAGPDSVNALPALLGQSTSPNARTNLIAQSGASSLFEKNKEGLWAMREGNWKLVMGQGSGYSTGQGDRNPYLRYSQVGMVNSDHSPDGKLKPGAPPMQLYDLAADPGETRNLYREHPEIVMRLSKLFEHLSNLNTQKP